MENAQQRTASASQTSVVGGKNEIIDVKLKAVDALSQEIESLKVVVDLRNAEICQLKQSNGELQKQVICSL